LPREDDQEGLFNQCLTYRHYGLAERLAREKIVAETPYPSPLLPAPQTLQAALDQRQFEWIPRLLLKENGLEKWLRGKELISIQQALNAGCSDVAGVLFDYSILRSAELTYLIEGLGTDLSIDFIHKTFERAIRMNDLPAMLLILDRFHCKDCTLVSGYTPLHLCVKSNFSLGISLLLDLEADPNQRDGFGRTPLLIAIEERRFYAIKQLLSITNLNLRDKRALGPLQMFLMAPLLFSSFIDEAIYRTQNLNAGDCDGNAPLHYTSLAIQRFQNQVEIESSFSSLINKGASLQLKNQQGIIPQQFKAPSTDHGWEIIFGHIHSMLNFGSRNYEGSNPLSMLSSIQKLTPYRLLSQEFIYLHDDLKAMLKYPNLPSLHDIYSYRISLGRLTIVPVSSQDHMVYLVFALGYMAICDRTRPRTLDVYQINPNQFTPQMLQSLLNCSQKTSLEVAAYFHLELLPSLKGLPNQITQKLCSLSLKRQKVGNCVYANWKAAIRIAFAFRLWNHTPLSLAIAEAKSLSKSLSTDLRLDSIDQAIRHDRDPIAIQFAIFKVKNRLDVYSLARRYKNPLMEQFFNE
jgi:ankyrin repeat protein